MKIDQFQKEAKRTCAELGEKLNLCHMVFGMHTELDDYLKAVAKGDKINEIEEISDGCWFLANYCTFRGYNLNSLWKHSISTEKGLIHNLHTLDDMIKKYIAYDYPIPFDKEKEILYGICYNYQRMFNGVDVEHALENNINKLRVRFPDKFDSEKALNRDLESERKELSKGLE